MRRATVRPDKRACLVLSAIFLLSLAFVFSFDGSAALSQDLSGPQSKRQCATRPPSQAMAMLVHARARAFRESNRETLDTVGVIRVPVHFHVIYHGQTGNVTDQQLESQITMLNNVYSSHNVRFEKVDVTRTENEAWFKMDYGSAEERAAKTALGADPKRNLNFYTANLPFPLLGWATFPWDLAGDPVRDGVVLLFSSLPGGEAPFDQGKTGVHEVGHWLGLFHTFEGGCDDPNGDFVDDTPAHRGPNFGTPAENSEPGCQPNTFAPVHNYMNYTDDAWRTQLTSGQVQRIRTQIPLYRPLLIEAPTREKLKR